MSEIEFTTPIWLITFYDFTGVTSIILNILGFYLLMWQNGKMGPFRYYLLSFQVVCAVLDIHLTILMQPVPLYPINAGFTVGVLTVVFGVPTHYSFEVALLLIGILLQVLIFCFYTKHQLLAQVLRKRVAPLFLSYLYFGVAIISNVTVVVGNENQRLSKEEQWEYIKEVYPEYLTRFQSLSNFNIYKLTSVFYTMLFFAVISVSFLFFIFLFSIIDTVRLMIELKAKISTVTYQKHQSAIRCLLVQACTSALCIGAPFLFMGGILIKIDNQQKIAEILICWFVSHSTINNIGLIVFFPPYRKFFKVVFCKKNRKLSIMVGASTKGF